MKRTLLLSLIVWAVLWSGSVAFAVVPDTKTIPSELERWGPWVLHGSEAHLCPITYNNGEQFQCVWPSRLYLALDRKGGRFAQEWRVFVKDWAALPGSQSTWPLEVKVDGKAVPLVGRRDVPMVSLEPGRHVVEGSFVWDEMPEMMNIPAASGLVTLAIEGKPVDLPLFDDTGRLWLQQRSIAGKQEDRLEIKIYRLIDDSIPMQVHNFLKITISGQAREVKLDKVLLEKAVPMLITSPLPARFGPGGELYIQARPGRWDGRIVTRFEEPVRRIGPVTGAFGQEVWSFQAENHLRMVQIEGVSGVDPKQTDVPGGWERFPAYVIEPGAVMSFKEIRRGDPDPAPDMLNLKRTWWLDFDGAGFTIQDHIDGTMSSQWYLAMNSPGILGRVSVDGADQLITSQGPDKKPGVELRKGRLNLVAESRYEASNTILPAVGWDHDFQSVSGALCLPPGWRLLTARGVDIIPGTWIERWTLLDLFLVLIISLAVLKLWNVPCGLLALATVALTYHEPGAPRIVWLGLLAAVALLRFLPAVGWARKWTSAFRTVSLVALLVISIPFMVEQIRWGIYPQLEFTQPVSGMLGEVGQELPPTPPPERQDVPSAAAPKRMAPAPSRLKSEGGMDKLDYMSGKTALTQDPHALIQTGPGLPTWTWRSITMKWNGPVARNQQISLWLLSPAANLVLAFLRVVLLAFLIYVMLDLHLWKKLGKPAGTAVAAAILLLLFASRGMAVEVGASNAASPVRTVSAASTAGFPSPDLLQQLRNRLLEPPDCLPNCAESPGMEVFLTGESLRVLFQIHAATETAVPLPGNARSWLPEKVSLDDRPAEGLVRDKDGLLWVLVPAGVHTATLLGKAPPGDSFQLSLPLRPHRAQVVATGWDVQGIHQEGQVQGSIQLTRQRKAGGADARTADLTGAALPPFVYIERELSLGLTWQVFTTVRRITPPGTPVVALVPLIAGESVTTSGIRVEDGKVLVNMEPAASEIKWNSILERRPVIQLQATSGDDGASWAETWILDASPIWHCEMAGIPVIHHQDGAGFWKPQWQPWPGEKVNITVSRPEAIPGQLVTIDGARLELVPGERFNKSSLTLTIRTSQGGQHGIVLPSDAKLQQVRINGKTQPVKQQGEAVMVPLQPGMQNVSLEWHQDREGSFFMVAPEVSIGAPEQRAVNAAVTFKMESKRWILWAGGPRLGPAVLFWSYIVVVMLAAFGLGKIPRTPLKTRHWLLLGLGLTQVEPLLAIMIVGWLLALGLREKHPFGEGYFTFNLTQLALVAWTLAAMGGLYLSIEKGLLGIPDMQIAGNGSSNFLLNWTQDRILSTMPRPWVLSLPMYVYRALMLLWALWLAQALLGWLSWGWQSFSKGGLWHKRPPRKADQPES